MPSKKPPEGGWVIAEIDAAWQSASMEPTPTYRADIDGLRAIAVLSVILYHFGVWPFTGGFVGVDVFFVISGYLITGKLYEASKARKLSLPAFYASRARRILPALIVVVVATQVLGALVLAPDDLASLGWQSVSSAFGLSNFYFLKNTGYFDQSAELLPLLHTWSLAVEEQFYLVWPLAALILLQVLRVGRAVLIAALATVVAASFAASVFLVAESSQVAFYMLPSRAWELALGAIAVFAPRATSRAAATALTSTGLALIAFAVVSLDATAPFPGVNAIAPTLGAAFIVWPKSYPDRFSRLLSFTPLVGIGLISYSAYLWHWPLLTLFRHYINGAAPAWHETAVLALLTFALAWASWRFIEQPFRKMRLRPRILVAPVMAALAITAIPGYLLAQTGGLDWRLPTDAQPLLSRQIMWKWPCDITTIPSIGEDVCTFGTPWAEAERRAVVWGDSHARHLSPILAVSALAENTSFAEIDACPPMIGGRISAYDPARPNVYDRCGAQYRKYVQAIAADASIDLVIVSAYWARHIGYLVNPSSEDAGQTQTELLRLGLEAFRDDIGPRDLLIVGDVPNFGTISPVSCVLAGFQSLVRRACDVTPVLKREYERDQGDINDVFSDLAEASSLTHTYLLGEALCATGQCRTTVAGEFIYRDADHLRRNLEPETNAALADLFGFNRLASQLNR